MVTTAKLRGTAFVEIDPIQANVSATTQACPSMRSPRPSFQAGTNVDYAQGKHGGTSLPPGNQITPGDTFTAANVRLEKARLRRANVPTFGGAYVAYIHPDVAYDLMGETGTSVMDRPAHLQPARRDLAG